MELAGRNALVLGLGVSGLSMARWLTYRGARVRVADTRAVPPCAAQLQRELPGLPVDTGALRRESFENVDLIAISPGVSTAELLVETAASRGVPVVGDIELFAQALPSISAG